MGWNSYKLVTFGCSFTYGHGLADCVAQDGSHGPTASKRAWPSILGGLTDMQVDNASIAGSSNLMITKTIVDYSKYDKNTVVVIMWSHNNRETIYKDGGEEKLHMLPGFLNAGMPKDFWWDKEDTFKKDVTTYYETFHEDWNATLNQMIRMNFVHAFLKSKGIQSFHVYCEHYHEDFNYFKKFNVRDLNLKRFNWSDHFHIDDALDVPNPHPGPKSHALIATNLRRWFFS